MNNKQIRNILRQLETMLELHDENPFKVKSLSIAIFNLRKLETPLAEMSLVQLQSLEGIGKSIALYIDEINRTSRLSKLDSLIAQTPTEIALLASLKGIGPKKARILWTSLGLETLDAVLAQCQQGRIAGMKGFGEKTQSNIQEAIQFYRKNKGKFLYADVCPLAEQLLASLTEAFPNVIFSYTGDFRRKLEIIDALELLCATSSEKIDLQNFLNNHAAFAMHPRHSSPFSWKGAWANGLPVTVSFCQPQSFGSQLVVKTGSSQFLDLIVSNGNTMRHVATSQSFETEQSLFSSVGLPYIEPELREEGIVLSEIPSPLLEWKDIQGSLHNHSTWSDGVNTIEEMAQACIARGWKYFGIADHSKLAVYANGLNEEQIVRQHQEIDELNKTLAPFRVFKGIEADIREDGSLDYNDEILSTFDFVVASIHSGLSMNKQKATQRLLRAIENPYTTILGHPTGRLLLDRDGYSIDHKAVIDACVAHGVIIEINAHPRRLDLDWRWIRYAVSQGAMLSINPDAHDTNGLDMMQFGIAIARKGGLTPAHTFNTKSLNEIADYFAARKNKKLLPVI